MKKLLVAAIAALAIATPAQAQVTVYNDHPMTWQTPTGCRSGIRFLPEKTWTDGACMRVEVSTAGKSHNIHFVTENTRTVYVTSLADPTHVHAVAFVGDDGSAAVPARGECVITPKGLVSCAAVANESIGVTHVASFIGTFPELSAILR